MDPKIYSQDQHLIDTSHIDEAALAVIRRLHDAGKSAYLVGGGVRDLLMGLSPKDFDISTEARPEEIKKLFGGQCLLIGRRFRLAHIRSGRQVFEVSTFRAGDNETGDLITRDNTWGSEEEDVTRRDFTINGLFFDPETRDIIDYVDGVHDLKSHLLKTIGEPALRFKQDPVRMIRLLKFRARFGFAIDEPSWTALFDTRDEIVKSSPVRVMEELLRMLESGSAAPFFPLLEQTGLLPLLLPSLSASSQKLGTKTLFTYLKTADHFHRHHSREKLDRSVLLAALVLPLLEDRLGVLSFEELSFKDLLDAIEVLIEPFFQNSFIRFTKQQRFLMEFVLAMQQRFDQILKTKKIRPRLLNHPDFSKAMQLFFLRSHHHAPLRPAFQQWKEAMQTA